MKDSRSFLLQDGLLYCRGPRGDRLCIPAAGGLRLQVLTELQATPLGGHFGRYKTLALARRSAHWHAQPRRHQLLLPLCLSPAGFSIDAAPPGDPRLRALREGRTLLYWWPAAAGDSDGWQRGIVARLCPRGASRTWSPTHGRRRRCAAPQTHSWTQPRTANVGLAFS